jgi:hypothetical protein
LDWAIKGRAPAATIAAAANSDFVLIFVIFAVASFVLPSGRPEGQLLFGTIVHSGFFVSISRRKQIFVCRIV